MATKIQWTDETWNPVTGCTRVSEGCRHCYAEALAGRRFREHPRYRGTTRNGRWTGNVLLHPDKLDEPLHWRKPRKIFVCDMSDLFHEAVPNEFVDRVFAAMALCPRHTFQVLTKRPERMAMYLNTEFVANRVFDAEKELTPERGVWSWPTWKEAFAHLWIGTSIEDQDTADERIPHLLRCPAAVRFLSVEPLLEAIKLPFSTGTCCDCRSARLIGMPTRRWYCEDCDADQPQIDWVIVGGESGPDARPCDVEWIRDIMRQCRAAGVPVFVKQLGSLIELNAMFEDELSPIIGAKSVRWDGEYQIVRPRDHHGGDPCEWPEDLRVREFPAEVRA